MVYIYTDSPLHSALASLSFNRHCRLFRVHDNKNALMMTTGRFFRICFGQETGRPVLVAQQIEPVRRQFQVSVDFFVSSVGRSIVSFICISIQYCNYWRLDRSGRATQSLQMIVVVQYFPSKDLYDVHYSTKDEIIQGWWRVQESQVTLQLWRNYIFEGIVGLHLEFPVNVS